MILRGMRTAARANALSTAAKILPLLLFIGFVIAAFRHDTFAMDFWGAPALGSILDQVKSTMLVTVWVFIDIEGANVFSARASERADVGRATVIGFVITLLLLIAVSLLSLGILKQPELAALKNPSEDIDQRPLIRHWTGLFFKAKNNRQYPQIAFLLTVIGQLYFRRYVGLHPHELERHADIRAMDQHLRLYAFGRG